MTTSIPFASLLTLCLTACTSSSGTSIHDLDSRLIAALCASEVACNQQPDQATCEASYPSVTTAYDATLSADVDAGVIHYDGATFSACLDELGSGSCKLDGSTGIAACLAGVFTGTLAIGDSCFINEECGSQDCQPQDATCDPGAACCPGACVAAPTPLAIGDACEPAQCGAGLYCNGGAGPGVCVAVGATQGAACTTNVFPSCADPFACSPDPAGDGGGTCQPHPAEGAACAVAGVQCVDARDYCDATTLVCTPLAAIGAACSADVPCEGLANCAGGSCVARGALGSACTPSDDAPCLGALACTNGVCAAEPEMAGSACH